MTADPYALLARFGVARDSTIARVLDASYEMTPEELATPAINEAWEALRTIRQRVHVDLLDPALPPGPPAAASTFEPYVPWRLLAELAAPDPDAFAALTPPPDPPNLPNELEPLHWSAALALSNPRQEP